MKKKLLAYNITGRTYTSETEYFDWNKVVGIDINQWTETDINNKKAFIVIFEEDEILEDYVDISSIENWDRFGHDVTNDYLVVKDQIKILVLEKGWETLTSIEKDLAIKYYSFPDFEVPIIYLITEKGMTQQLAQQHIMVCWHIHHKKLLEVCRERWFYVKLVVASFLNFHDAEELMDIANPLIFNFIECGRFGIEYGDQRDGLLDFITSKHMFYEQGLKEQNYELNFGTWEMFIDSIVNVLLNGVYDKYNI